MSQRIDNPQSKKINAQVVDDMLLSVKKALFHAGRKNPYQALNLFDLNFPGQFIDGIEIEESESSSSEEDEGIIKYSEPKMRRNIKEEIDELKKAIDKAIAIYERTVRYQSNFFSKRGALPRTQIKKIIFLDIDGVLYIGSCFDHEDRADQVEKLIEKIKSKHLFSDAEIKNPVRGDYHNVTGFDQRAVKNLQDLCKKHDAKIVVTSNWRKDRTIGQLKIIFAALDLEDYFLDVTKVSDSFGRQRELEIEDWLLRHSGEVSSFVIIDDEFCAVSKLFGERFAYCHSGTLFNNKKLDEADKILQHPLDCLNEGKKSCFEAIIKNMPACGL